MYRVLKSPWFYFVVALQSLLAGDNARTLSGRWFEWSLCMVMSVATISKANGKWWDK